MKRFTSVVLAVVLCISFAGATIASAKDKIQIRVYSCIGEDGIGTELRIEISIRFGKIEYIADASHPEKLRYVRVWKRADSLLYDLYPDRVSYAQAPSNEPATDKKMSQVEVAKLWVQYTEKFARLQKSLSVEVH